MKKITLFLLSLMAFQVQGQLAGSAVIDSQIYNIKNYSTTNYLRGNNTSVYQTTIGPGPFGPAANIGLNFQFVTPEAGATDYNILNIEEDGIMQAAAGVAVRSSFPADGTTTAKAAARRFYAVPGTGDYLGTYQFRLSNLGVEQYLYAGVDGTYVFITPAAMIDAGNSVSDGVDRSYWSIEVSQIPTANTLGFDSSSIVVANPVNDDLIINGLTSEVEQVVVYSLLGQKVLSSNLRGEPSAKIDVTSLAKGMYIVKLSGKTGSFTKKIIKN